VIILASHLPGEGYFRSTRFSVESISCDDDLAYWRGLQRHWDSDLTIVNLEHDLEVADEHIARLLACPYPCCSHAYACHWASTGLPHDVYAAGLGGRDIKSQPIAEYLQGGEPWANWSAIGLVKLAPAARTGPLREEPWSQLELAVHDAVKRPWHMHWDTPEMPPVVHHHW
jgi:hypothetical protein